MPSVKVYRYATRGAAQPYHELPSGLSVAGTGVVAFDWSDIDDEALGATVQSVLAEAAGVLPERPRDATTPRHRALGVSSERVLERDARLVSVAPIGARLDVHPMINDGPGQGFSYDPEQGVQLEQPSNGELAAAIRQAMEHSGPTAQRAQADEPEDEEPEDAEGELVADLLRAAEWIAVALTASGYRADWSVESLREIDRFFDEQLKRPGKPRRRGLLAEELGARLFALGGYVGEVVRRAAGGRWSAAEGAAEYDVELELPDGSIAWPVQRVMERFRLGPEAGVAVYGAALTRGAG